MEFPVISSLKCLEMQISKNNLIIEVSGDVIKIDAERESPPGGRNVKVKPQIL